MIAQPNTIREAIRATEDILHHPPRFLVACVSDVYRGATETREQGRENWREETRNRLNALKRLLAHAEDIEQTREKA